MDLTLVLRASIGLMLKLFNVILHSVGFFLLQSVQKRTGENIQLVYITNLSIVELIINLLSFSRNLLKVTGFQVFKTQEFKFLLTYSYIFDYAILKFCLYMTMIVLTLDRLFLITLNTIYRKHCSVKTAKGVVRLAWFIGVCLFAGMMYSYVSYSTEHGQLDANQPTVLNFSNPNDILNKTTEKINEVIERHSFYHNNTRQEETLVEEKFSPTVLKRNRDKKMFFVANTITLVFDFLFLPIAVISYTIIFSVYTRRQRRLHSTRSKIDPGSQQNPWRSFQKSRFYVSLLLIVTFVLFIIPADIIWMHYCLKESNAIVETVTTISYALSYLSDGVIYIMINPKVKKLFVLKLQRLNLLSSNGDACVASFSEPSNGYLSAQSTFISNTPRGSKDGAGLSQRYLTVPEKHCSERRILVVGVCKGQEV